MLFGKFFDGSIFVAPANNVLEHVGEEFHGSASFMLSAFLAPPVWLAGLGVLDGVQFFLVAAGARGRRGSEVQMAVHHIDR